jgi:hypothetical protein
VELISVYDRVKQAQEQRLHTRCACQFDYTEDGDTNHAAHDK